jgi:DNA-binding NtrC family response regulator
MNSNSKARILVLDDEPIVGERLKPALEHADFEVETCVSSEEALKRLEREFFDVLITDLKMSGPDGMDVMRTAQKLHPQIKVVVITGFATRKTFDEAMEQGAVEFIAKPFKMSQLRNLLLRIIKEDKR